MLLRRRDLLPGANCDHLWWTPGVLMEVNKDIAGAQYF